MKIIRITLVYAALAAGLLVGGPLAAFEIRTSETDIFTVDLPEDFVLLKHETEESEIGFGPSDIYTFLKDGETAENWTERLVVIRRMGKFTDTSDRMEGISRYVASRFRRSCDVYIYGPEFKFEARGAEQFGSVAFACVTKEAVRSDQPGGIGAVVAVAGARIGNDERMYVVEWMMNRPDREGLDETLFANMLEYVENAGHLCCTEETEETR
jgi:hypothetical protein